MVSRDLRYFRQAGVVDVAAPGLDAREGGRNVVKPVFADAAAVVRGWFVAPVDRAVLQRPPLANHAFDSLQARKATDDSEFLFSALLEDGKQGARVILEHGRFERYGAGQEKAKAREARQFTSMDRGSSFCTHL